MEQVEKVEKVRQRYLVAQVRIKREYINELSALGVPFKGYELPDDLKDFFDSKEYLFYMRFPCGNTIETFYDGSVKISGGERGFVVKDGSLLINNRTAPFIDGLRGELAIKDAELSDLKVAITSNALKP